MTTSTLLRLFGLSRVALGVWLCLAPRKPAELWFGDVSQPASTTALVRSVGGRDIGLGLGLVANPTADSAWLRAGVLADFVDSGTALMVRNRIPRKNFLTGFLGAAMYAIVGAAVATRGRAD